MLKLIKSLYYKYFYKPKEWEGTTEEWSYMVLKATAKMEEKLNAKKN